MIRRTSSEATQSSISCLTYQSVKPPQISLDAVLLQQVRMYLLMTYIFAFFFFNDPPPPEIYPFPLHAALPIYVHFVRDKTLLEAIASSLTELFSPVIIGERVEGMLKGYPFVTAETLAFFAKRPPQAKKDSD